MFLGNFSTCFLMIALKQLEISFIFSQVLRKLPVGTRSGNHQIDATV